MRFPARPTSAPASARPGIPGVPAAAAIVVVAMAAVAPAAPAASATEWPDLPADYENRPGCAKEAFLWKERVEPSAYAPGARPEIPGLGALSLAWLTITGRLARKMDHAGDQAPAGWTKPIHHRGSVARVAFVAVPGGDTPGATGATGLLAGAPCGFLRVSLTSRPGEDAVNPGFAWKAFVDGRPARNLSALVSLDGQGADFNLFRHAYSHVVPPSSRLSARVAKAAFETVSRHAHKVGVEEFAAFGADGRAVPSPRAPRQLVFVPDAALRAGFPATPPRDFRDDLATLPAGTTLFRVYGLDALVPDDAWDAARRAGDGTPVPSGWRPLGDLVTTSAFVASAWGDDGIFFRHERYQGE